MPALLVPQNLQSSGKEGRGVFSRETATLLNMVLSQLASSAWHVHNSQHWDGHHGVSIGLGEAIVSAAPRIPL